MPEGILDTLDIPNIDQHPCIDVSTRYFTSRHEDPMGEAIPFAKTVDPKGTLLSICNGDLFHGPENEVLYYTMVKDDSGSKPK